MMSCGITGRMMPKPMESISRVIKTKVIVYLWLMCGVLGLNSSEPDDLTLGVLIQVLFSGNSHMPGGFTYTCAADITGGGFENRVRLHPAEKNGRVQGEPLNTDQAAPE